MSSPLVPIEMDPPQTIAGVPTARLEWAPEQRSSPPTIAFRLRIVNDTPSGITVQNPYDGVTYSLSDAEGWPISIRQPARLARLPGPRRPKDKLGYLSVLAIDLDGDSVAPAEGIEREELRLEPGSMVGFDFAITHAAAKEGDDATVPVHPGTYHVTLVANLRWVQDGEPDTRSLIVRSNEATVTQRGS